MGKRCLLLILLALLAGCAGQLQTPSAVQTAAPTALPMLETDEPFNTPSETAAPSRTPTFWSTPTPTLTRTPSASGPESFPAGVNPLTGLALEDPSLLELSPGLVSISNAPASARPQAGLSYAAQVYEFYLGEGSSRFLSVFYGNLPPVKNTHGEAVEVGPLRSGRLPYETLRQFYNGFLVFASAAERVLEHLDEYQIVQNPNIQDINGAVVSARDLIDLGSDTFTRLGSPALSGQRFDTVVPTGGKPADKVWVDFHRFDQVFWKYDPQRLAYTRWQDDGEGTPMREQVDRINGEALAFSNVVVMFTNYVRYTDTYFNIDFKYIFRWPALLFRDGRMYEIYWTTRSSDYEQRTGRMRPPRFINAQGEPFALRPGQTWIEILQLNNPYYETVDSENFASLLNQRKPGSGVWGVVFVPPDFSPEPTPEK